MVVFQKARRVLDANVGGSVKQSGLTMAQFGVLDVLCSKGDMRICQLLDKLLATSGNMTVVLKNMEKKGWIKRTIAEKDKRAQVISVTKEGRQLFESVLPHHIREIEEVFSAFSQEELTHMIELLKNFRSYEQIV